jgi:hypothetical protein
VPELIRGDAGADTVLLNLDEVTLEDLASHLSGIARDFGLNDLAVHDHEDMAGYPGLHSLLLPLASADKPPCGYVDRSGTYMTCDRSDLVPGIANSAAVFHTGSTPAYKCFAQTRTVFPKAKYEAWKIQTLC